MRCVGVDDLKGFFMTTGIKLIGATLLLLANSGCGKSEVDKCVEVGMKGFDARCAAKPFDNSDCTAPGGRSDVEFGFRQFCLKAARGN